MKRPADRTLAGVKSSMTASSTLLKEVSTFAGIWATSTEYGSSGLFIDFGDIQVAPLLRWQFFPDCPESMPDDFMGTFPDDKKGCAGVERYHWNTENERMMLAQMPAPVGTFR